MPKPFPLEPALWTRTAIPAPPTPALAESTRADVCIVGGGYTGLSTALHLSERGIDAVLLEAYEPGWGASGRNGGQVIPGLKWDPSDLIGRLGPKDGGRLIEFAAGTADLVFDLIERHGMDVPRTRSGWIQGAHRAEGIDIVRRRAAEWAERGVAGARFLDRQEVGRLTGTDAYLAGWLDPRGGTIQPLSFTRGLAVAALRAGARLHGQSPVARLRRHVSAAGTAEWAVVTEAGPVVSATQVVVATNAYSGLGGRALVQDLARTVVAPNSYQIATEPLSHNVARSILPEGHFVSDTRQLLFYFRLDHENRLIMGGRGPLREPRSQADWAHLVEAAGRLYPQVKGVAIQHRWCGRVAVTRDFLPHLHAPEPGLLVDIGCMGRGVGLHTAMGRAMARRIATGDDHELPLGIERLRPLPLHGAHKAYVGALVAWHRLRDGGLA